MTDAERITELEAEVGRLRVQLSLHGVVEDDGLTMILNTLTDLGNRLGLIAPVLNRFHQDMKGMASAIDYLGDREAERSELEARA